ncbi:MAG: sugar phosphate nucleotidyltransferase [Anaerovoracaceae bacterium]
MNAFGIIFSNVRDRNVPELTRDRIMGAVPFGGRYRLVDFALSNMANSDVDSVGLVTRKNYLSLAEHVGSGKPWDMDRKNGGLFLLPPFGENIDDELYVNRLDAMKKILFFIERSLEKYVILADADVICHIDYDKVLAEHKKTGADVTVVYKEVEFEGEWKTSRLLFDFDENGRVKKIKRGQKEKAKIMCLCIT